MVTPTPNDTEPLAVRRGDTSKWYRSSGELDASTWSITYGFVKKDETAVTVAGVADFARWLITITPAVSALLAVGTWHWSASIDDATDRYTVATGALVVEPDFLTDTDVDPRSFAQRMVDLLEIRHENRAPNDIVASSFEAASITVMSDGEAREQLQFWRRRVATERSHRQTQEGRGNRGKIQSRFISR